MMGKTQTNSLDELADAFLAEHDPFFKDARRNKCRRLEYPYLSAQRQKRIAIKEIPFSNLQDGYVGKCADKDIDLSNFREEAKDQ